MTDLLYIEQRGPMLSFPTYTASYLATITSEHVHRSPWIRHTHIVQVDQIASFVAYENTTTAACVLVLAETVASFGGGPRNAPYDNTYVASGGSYPTRITVLVSCDAVLDALARTAEWER